MRKALRIRYTDEFLAITEELPLDKTIEHAGKVFRQLQTFPDMGNARPRKMLRDRYGADIRTMPVDHYLLVYRHDDATLTIVSLVWAAPIK
ncbi:MAG: type II toxin-antitoxin system RelE/ParE family toxin [Coriobacteriales bacterium]|nr:type II toxin-antitoxin system RelE/ParE family toxin [Coriobacteriales bacterium]